jgi:hypothetical protein
MLYKDNCSDKISKKINNIELIYRKMVSIRKEQT